MADLFVSYDASKQVGERLGPAVRAEVEAIAPANIAPGSIGSDELAPDAVQAPNLAPESVEREAIKVGAVGTDQLGNGVITGPKVQDHTLGPDKMDAGIVTARDAQGNDIVMPVVPISSADYSALSTPNPNTVYLIF